MSKARGGKRASHLYIINSFRERAIFFVRRFPREFKSNSRSAVAGAYTPVVDSPTVYRPLGRVFVSRRYNNFFSRPIATSRSFRTIVAHS